MAVDKPKYIGQQAFADMLGEQVATAIIDCRDNDRHEGGWIRGSTHFPSRQASEAAFAMLLEQLKQDKVQRVVFHCMFSQARGPGLAARFVTLFPPAVRGNMDVYILDGGFKGFFHWAQSHAKQGLIETSSHGFL